MSNESKKRTADEPRQRENEDPNESNRPLPWFLVMSLGAMAMWGAFSLLEKSSIRLCAYLALWVMTLAKLPLSRCG